MATDTEGSSNLEAGFGVGNCWAEPLAGIVECGDLRLHVEPKVMDVLMCLARHPGTVVTRDMLLSSVWGDVVVTDDVLTRCVSELRTLLGDTDRERRFIRTIPKRGYSLIAPVSHSRLEFTQSLAAGAEPTGAVTPGPAPTGARNRAAGGGARDKHRMLQIGGLLLLMLLGLGIYVLVPGDDEAQIEVVGDGTGRQTSVTTAESASAARPGSGSDDLPESLAVLPFVNLSADPTHDFFSDGLSEDIRNGMLTSTELRVSARTSSRAFKGIAIDVREIGRQLEVDALLEGTVRINDGHLRVTTQLTDVDDGYPLWAASYERDLGESISTQVEIAQAIVRDIAPSLTGGQDLLVGTPTNIAAHEYYLLGRHQWHLRNPASLELAVTYFEDALELDPNYALAYSGLADAHLLRIGYAGQPAPEMIELATRYTERALELGPDLAEAHASLGLLRENKGEIEAARDAYLRAVEIKPHYSMAQMWLGTTLMELRELEQSWRHLSVARDLDPLHPQVQFNYANSLMLQGRHEEARASIDNFLRFRQSEILTHQKLAVDFYTGRYDLMLQNAVGYTYGGAFTPYNSRIVIESLIYLHRFDEAERMIVDNASDMDELVNYLLRGELAVARRDASALRAIGAAMIDAAPSMNSMKKGACVGVWADAFRAAADFIAGDFAAAVARFGQLAEPGADVQCLLEFPEGRATVLTYLAASRMKLDPQDAEAARLLAAADADIRMLRDRGFDTPPLGIADAAVRWYRGDGDGAAAVLEAMDARGWRIYGLMRFSPLYDELLASGPEGVPAALRNAFEPIERDCERLGLAKLGL